MWALAVWTMPGHIAKVCRSSQLTKISRKQTKTHFVNQDYTCIRTSTTDVSEEQQEQEEDSYTMFTTRDNSTELIVITRLLNDVSTDMEFDTGASLSVINKTTYSKMSRGDSPEVKLKTYTGESIPVIGTIKVHTKQEEVLPVLVVEGTGPNLMGRDWLCKIKVDLDQSPLYSERKLKLN